MHKTGTSHHSAVIIYAPPNFLPSNHLQERDGKLEKARGFPHFSERFVEREEARNMKERMKEYKDTHKSNKKIVSDMDDISPVNQEIEKYQEVHNPSIMDDI